MGTETAARVQELLGTRYQAIIGLEVHAQLLTVSKIFCSCCTTFGAPPNTNVCPVCLGHPGVLPVLNEEAVALAVRAALGLSCHAAEESVFARKNYFYPDLPKGYQISQFDRPLARDGHLEIVLDDARRRIGITRVHLEEDAGKAFHTGEMSLIDFNRCGVPLIEIVSEPDLRSPREAYQYLRRLRQTLRYLEVSDCNMEEGSLRCDVNISVRPFDQEELGVKTEIKNLNSFRAVEQALTFEIDRQMDLLEAGKGVVQETRLWDADREEARPMRTKEESHDYRYFPEPDLMPLRLDAAWVEEIRAALPELPAERERRLQEELGLPAYDAAVIADERAFADLFEECTEEVKDKKAASNLFMVQIKGIMNERNWGVQMIRNKLKPRFFSELVDDLIGGGAVSFTAGKDILLEMLETGKAPRQILEEKGLAQLSDRQELSALVAEVLTDHPEEVKRYLDGKEGLLGFFVGQVMQTTGGRANPQLANQVIREALEARRTDLSGGADA